MVEMHVPKLGLSAGIDVRAYERKNTQLSQGGPIKERCPKAGLSKSRGGPTKGEPGPRREYQRETWPETGLSVGPVRDRTPLVD